MLGLRVAKLKKLGTVPEKYKDQVTFFINLEAKIHDILDLGDLPIGKMSSMPSTTASLSVSISSS